MSRSSRITAAPLLLSVALAAAAVGPALAQDAPLTGHTTYALTGDDGGSKFEGIGIDQVGQTFYVSEVTGGEIHRGDLGTGSVEEWLGEGADDRFTARGITSDEADRIYIAGGPNGMDNDRPDMWVYAADGELLAALKVDAPNAFINDVVIGPDGAAYFTNSNVPQIFRVAETADGWGVETWLDASADIEQQDGFNLGGLVVSPDESALIVAQGNVGALWRVGLDDMTVEPVATGDIDLTGADGLVQEGTELIVVRNFPRVLTTLALDADARTASLLGAVATDPERVFTTAKVSGGDLLLIDSKFDEETAEPPFEVVAINVEDLTR
jgi:sugar lactone lactonase YvrE